LGDGCGVVVVEGEVCSALPSPVNEELDRLVLLKFGGVLIAAGIGERQGRDAPAIFSVYPKTLPARGEDSEGRARAEEALRQGGNCLYQVFAIIEDQEEVEGL
jgi:hypothetical protein